MPFPLLQIDHSSAFQILLRVPNKVFPFLTKVLTSDYTVYRVIANIRVNVLHKRIQLSG